MHVYPLDKGDTVRVEIFLDYEKISLFFTACILYGFGSECSGMEQGLD